MYLDRCAKYVEWRGGIYFVMQLQRVLEYKFVHMANWLDHFKIVDTYSFE